MMVVFRDSTRAKRRPVKVFCLAEGPNKKAVQRVHERAGHPVEEIDEVPLNVK